MKTIKAAAIKLEDGEVVSLSRPARHSDIISFCRDREYNRISVSGAVQGFITEEDVFVNRNEAYIIAKENNQILESEMYSSRPVLLYTEDLW